MPEQPAQPTFREAYAHRTGCPAAEFERRLLRRCRPAWKHPLAALAQLLAPEAFALDLDFLKDVAEARTQSEVMIQLQAYRYEWQNSPKNKLRWLGLRLSGQRLIKAAAVLAEK